MCLALLSISSSPLAQDDGIDPKQLDEIREEITLHNTRSEELEREAEKLANETKGIRNKLVGLAARVQEKETAVSDAEQNMSDLNKQEKVLIDELDRQSEALAETLAALQTIQANPPPALFVHPDDATDAARSAILLSELAPALKEQADQLAAKLNDLATVREALIDQRDTLLLVDDDLARERQRLAKALADREKRYIKISGLAAEEKRRVQGLAAKAKSLEELIAGLRRFAQNAIPRRKPSLPTPSDNVPIPRKSPFETLGEGAPLNNPGLQSTPDRMASAGIARFSQARGRVRLPANGRMLASFGSQIGTGKSKGLTIATRPTAQVVAPFDGEIVFAGPYLGYGQLLIIAVGEGYHLVISGMTRIDGVVGQRLLAGEPIGQMGKRDSTGAKTRVDTSQAKKTIPEAWPELYLEIRKNGEPFDPLPWLAVSDGKAKG